MVRKNLLVVFLFVFVITAVIGTRVSAAPKTANPVNVVIDGETQVYSDQGPFTDNGYTLVPMRAIFEKLGAFIYWDSKKAEATAVKGDNSIVLTIGSKTAYLNDNPIYLQVEPRVYNGSTVIPLRFVSEALGAKVLWDGATRTAIIISAEELERNPDVSSDVKKLDPKYYDPAIYLDKEKYTSSERGVNEMLGFDFSGLLADSIFDMYAKEAARKQAEYEAWKIADDKRYNETLAKIQGDVLKIVQAKPYDKDKMMKYWFSNLHLNNNYYASLDQNLQVIIWSSFGLGDPDTDPNWRKEWDVKTEILTSSTHLPSFFDKLDKENKYYFWAMLTKYQQAYVWKDSKNPMAIWEMLIYDNEKYVLYGHIKYEGNDYIKLWNKLATPEQKKEAEAILANPDNAVVG